MADRAQNLQDTFLNYVRKNKIAESAVMGTFVEALCGEIFPVTKAPKPGSPVCPACKEIYEQDGREFYVFASVSSNQEGLETVRGTWTDIVRGA